MKFTGEFTHSGDYEEFTIGLIYSNDHVNTKINISGTDIAILADLKWFMSSVKNTQEEKLCFHLKDSQVVMESTTVGVIVSVVASEKKCVEIHVDTDIWLDVFERIIKVFAVYKHNWKCMYDHSTGREFILDQPDELW